MKNYKTIFLIVCVILTVSSKLAAQSNNAAKTNGGAFYVNFELPNFDFQELNTVLKNNEFLLISEPDMAYGMGYLMQFGRSMISFSSAACSSKTESTDNVWDLEFSSYSIDYGYDVLKSPELSLYPFVAFKSNSLMLKYYEKVNTFSTQEYLTSDIEERNIFNNRMYGVLGAGFSFHKIVEIGVKGGYLVPLHSSKLWINNKTQELQNAPEIKYPFFVDVFIGIGFFKNKPPKSTIEKE